MFSPNSDVVRHTIELRKNEPELYRIMCDIGYLLEKRGLHGKEAIRPLQELAIMLHMAELEQEKMNKKFRDFMKGIDNFPPPNRTPF